MHWPLEWFDLGNDEHVTAAREATRNKAGVYFLRRKGTSRMGYIGASEPGVIQQRKKAAPLRLWKTIRRHFQACASPGVYSFGSDNWCTSSTAFTTYELALMLCKLEHARELERDAIAHFDPIHNAEQEASTYTVSVGVGDDDEGIPF